jgi:hypothetical protein
VVLAFVSTDQNSIPLATTDTAYLAYATINEPARILSIEIIQRTDTITNLKSFYWDFLEPMGSQDGPRVYVGEKNNPIVGISLAEFHVDEIQFKISSLLQRSAYWTIEGTASVSGTKVTLQVKIARLGSDNAKNIDVYAFAGEPQTGAWTKVTYAFNPQTLSSIGASDIKNITFSKTLTSQELPGRTIYSIVLVNSSGVIEQGVDFE